MFAHMCNQKRLVEVRPGDVTEIRPASGLTVGGLGGIRGITIGLHDLFILVSGPSFQDPISPVRFSLLLTDLFTEEVTAIRLSS